MEQLPSLVPVLPIRNNVVFPSTSIPLVVGRTRSLAAIDQAQIADGLLIVVAQRAITESDPEPDDLYRVGTLCKIENSAPGEAGNRQVVVTGVGRFRISHYERDAIGFLSARGEILADTPGTDPNQDEALFLNLKQLSREILELLPGNAAPLVRLMERIDDPGYLTHICSAFLNLDVARKQELLETISVPKRMETLLASMRNEREVLTLQKEIRDKMSERLNKAQRDALLREQLRTIRTELGDEPSEDSAEELDTRLRDAHLPEEAAKLAGEELKRLKNLPTNSAEYHVIRTYLEWMAALPWSLKSEEKIDIPMARQVLDEDHYGLVSVKKRILQFLAVAKLRNEMRGPILCLVGPPGVGKTSLGASIARALGRKFTRTSLGGIRDEAEIRGHRRTYVGAMPGRIIQSLKRCETRNPVMMLDEIDKLGADFHGDPSAAMLEVLDPEQNWSFTDHYIDTPFNLSDVFFIATANIIDTIPGPLRDRMEIIEVSGYTVLEKMHIAREHLIPKMLREHGLLADWLTLSDQVLQRIVVNHTREAGVRELQRQIASLFRCVAELIVDGAPKPVEISEARLIEWLGTEKFLPELAAHAPMPGVGLGLAWTPHGGELLFVEAASLVNGSGRLVLTGQLGDVMKESAQLALSLLRSSALPDIPRDYPFALRDIHVHVPAGSIPKDGPSAGVTILASLLSLVSGKPLPSDLAMTGEITLRGAVLPVGGIKEKILAAHRSGIKRVILPRRNESDLKEVPAEVRSQLRFELVDNVNELEGLLFPPASAIAA